MRYQLNDETVTADPAPTVAEIVDNEVGSRDGIAVAVDGEVIPASAWEHRAVDEGARVDVLSAVQGG